MSAADPLLTELLELSRRYRVVIGLSALVASVAGLALGASVPSSYTAVATVEAAELSPEGPVEDLVTTCSQLENLIADEVLSGRLPQGTELEAMVVRDQPPPATKMALIDLRARSSDSEASLRAIDLVSERIEDSETPQYQAERSRILGHLKGVDADLSRLYSVPETVETHGLRIKLILERAEQRRRLSIVRLHPPRTLVGPFVEMTPVANPIIAYSVGGLLLGLFSGYLAAIFLTGARALRSMEEERPSGLV